MWWTVDKYLNKALVVPPFITNTLPQILHFGVVTFEHLSQSAMFDYQCGLVITHLYTTSSFFSLPMPVLSERERQKRLIKQRTWTKNLIRDSLAAELNKCRYFTNLESDPKWNPSLGGSHALLTHTELHSSRTKARKKALCNMSQLWQQQSKQELWIDLTHTHVCTRTHVRTHKDGQIYSYTYLGS